MIVHDVIIMKKIPSTSTHDHVFDTHILYSFFSNDLNYSYPCQFEGII